ncbi:MAG TPA: hypothetical protein VF965_01625, partial [Candidatus Limnocylindria bacterium]
MRAKDVVKRPALCGAIALLFAACTVSGGRPAESVSPAPTASAVITTPTPSPSLTTATPRPEPPVAASDPDALAIQIVSAERAIRDHSVTGADLAWFGHLQQLTYRRLAATPELRDT